MVSWYIESGQCPWCLSDRETLYCTYDQKICATCILKLYRASIDDIWLPLIKLTQEKQTKRSSNGHPGKGTTPESYSGAESTGPPGTINSKSRRMEVDESGV